MEPLRNGSLSRISTEICGSSDPKCDTLRVPEDDPTVGSSPEEVCQNEVSGRLKDSAVASNSFDGADSVGCGTKHQEQASAETKDRDLCSKVSSIDDLKTIESEKTLGTSKCCIANDCEGAAVYAINEDASNSSTYVLPESSFHDKDSEKVKDCGKHILGLEDVQRGNAVDVSVSAHTTDHSSGTYKFTEGKSGCGDFDVMKKKSDTELEYGLVDPLEVARQVAIEVEIQMADSEQSFSSGGAPNISQLPDSPDSAQQMGSCAQEDSSHQMPSEEDSSVDTSELRDEPARCAEHPANGPDGIEDMKCSQVTDMDGEYPADTGKGPCNIDLNEELCSEEMNRSENQIPTPATIVSDSTGSASPEFPISQLHFEGSLGWKASGAMNSFHQASQVPKVEKVHSMEGSNNSSKLRDGCLDIDLNVDEIADEKTSDPLVGTNVPGLSSLASGESSIEVSPRRSEMLLDLNSVANGDDPSEWSLKRQIVPEMNDCYHRISSSSSSSSKQPALMNIDLNDQPSFASGASDTPYFLKLSQNVDAPGVDKSDDSVVSIMGMRMKVKKDEFIPSSLPQLNGRDPNPILDVDLAGAGGLVNLGSTVAYSHPAVNGYAGFTPGMALPLSSGIYGRASPIPYLLDSRGAPVVPQLMGAAPALSPAFSTPSFMMNMPFMARSNGAGPSQCSFDLNSGLIFDGGARDNGGLRQFLNTGQSEPGSDPLTLNLLPSTPVDAGRKRKEFPLWESYPFKHHQPSWK